jgi:glycosyltransferase involved in cell wall biosynthesis
MPCYDRGYDLLRILQAYDRQATDQPFEIIAVDDASKDNTYQVLSSYQPQNYKISIIRLEKNQGPGNARNQGISRASSPLIAFVGDDILPSPGFVEDHLKAHSIYTDEKTAILGQITWPDDLPCNTLIDRKSVV